MFLTTYALEGWGLLENYVGLAIEEINLEVNGEPLLEIIKNDLDILSKKFSNILSKDINDVLCEITRAFEAIKNYLDSVYKVGAAEMGEVLEQEE